MKFVNIVIVNSTDLNLDSKKLPIEEIGINNLKIDLEWSKLSSLFIYRTETQFKILKNRHSSEFKEEIHPVSILLDCIFHDIN